MGGEAGLGGLLIIERAYASSQGNLVLRQAPAHFQNQSRRPEEFGFSLPAKIRWRTPDPTKLNLDPRVLLPPLVIGTCGNRSRSPQAATPIREGSRPEGSDRRVSHTDSAGQAQVARRESRGRSRRCGPGSRWRGR